MMAAMDVVIIGAGTAGVEVALAIRKADKDARVTIVDKGRIRPYSVCGLPYVIEGSVKSFEELFLFRDGFFSENGIDTVVGDVSSIDRKKNAVHVVSDGVKKTLPYDRLVICTGSKAFIPDIKGLSESGFHAFRTMDDARGLFLALSHGMKVAVIGAGYIGVEVAYGLSMRGMKVTLLEAAERILPTSFDRDVASFVEEHLMAKGISVHTGVRIDEVRKGKVILGGGAKSVDFDCLVVACGVRPDVSLAHDSGLQCERGVLVDEHMRTSDSNIYACGDCAEVSCMVSGKRTLSLLGSSAVREAHVAAACLLGGNDVFSGVLNTGVSAVGGVVFGSSGLTMDAARALGIKAVFGTYRGLSGAEYYPGAGPIIARVVARDDGRIIGFQVAGRGDISGRVNTASVAISSCVSVGQFASFEACYNPAVASVFDPLVMACDVCRRKLDVIKGRR